METVAGLCTVLARLTAPRDSLVMSLFNRYFKMLVEAVQYSIIRQPDVSRDCLKVYCGTFFLLSFLQGHGIQQPRSVRPSDVYRRFDVGVAPTICTAVSYTHLTLPTIYSV